MINSSVRDHLKLPSALSVVAMLSFLAGLAGQGLFFKEKPAIAQIAQELKDGMPHKFEFGWYHDYRVRTWQAYPQRGSVVFVGDSLTELGVWENLFPELNVINQGISGDTLGALISRIRLAYECGAHTAVLTIGANDILAGNLNIDAFLAKWILLIEDMHRNGLQIIATSIPATKSITFNKAASLINTKLKEHCSAGKCRYVDLNAVVAPNGTIDNEFTFDGLHLTPAGYKAWSSQLAPHLQQKGATPVERSVSDQANQGAKW